MTNIKKDIKAIIKKLDENLSSTQSQTNNKLLIQISSDFKDIVEVIQYFEQSIDSLRTQNEGIKDTFREAINDILEINEKIIDGAISLSEVQNKLKSVSESFDLNGPSLTKKIGTAISNILTPKFLFLLTVLFIMFSFYFYNSDKTVDAAKKAVKNSKIPVTILK